MTEPTAYLVLVLNSVDRSVGFNATALQGDTPEAIEALRKRMAYLKGRMRELGVIYAAQRGGAESASDSAGLTD
jgi:hypothetical protein